MNRRWAWIILAVLVSAAGVWGVRRGVDRTAQRTAAAALASARRAGFPVEYADFRLSLTPSERLRAEVVTNAGSRIARAWRGHREFGVMEPVAPASARCAWQGDRDWAAISSALASETPALDAAVSALLEDQPLRFEPVQHVSLLLPHLSALPPLATALSARLALALRDGRADVAWTNLLAVTALATRFEPEPAEVSHLVRSELVRQAFAATWEALRTNAWSDARLAELMEHWRRPDFFRGWPEVPAVAGAVQRVTAAGWREDARTNSTLRSELPNLARRAIGHPREAWNNLRSLLEQESQRRAYAREGFFRDEAIILKFSQARAAELKRAVEASDWLTMRRLPGVTNAPQLFLSPNSPVQPLVNMAALMTATMRFSAGVGSPPSPVASTVEAEALRRVMVTALALERTRIRTGRLPGSLAEVAGAERDFITGESLRYFPEDGGRYVLYSVGLNAEDEGGTMMRPARETYLARDRPDLVWPRVATAEEAATSQAARPRVLGLVDPTTGQMIPPPPVARPPPDPEPGDQRPP